MRNSSGIKTVSDRNSDITAREQRKYITFHSSNFVVVVVNRKYSFAITCYEYRTY